MQGVEPTLSQLIQNQPQGCRSRSLNGLNIRPPRPPRHPQNAQSPNTSAGSAGSAAVAYTPVDQSFDRVPDRRRHHCSNPQDDKTVTENLMTENPIKGFYPFVAESITVQPQSQPRKGNRVYRTPLPRKGNRVYRCYRGIKNPEIRTHLIKA
jgi:hypothetical protein